MGMIESQTPPLHEDKEETESAFSFPIYWDERDKYSKEEHKLLRRLGADYIGRKIIITELGTVCESTGKEKNVQETLFDKYMDDLEKRVVKEESSVKYDKETNCFYLVEKEREKYYPRSMSYKFDVNKEAMDNYAFGKYNKVTSRLQDLYVKSMTIEEKQNLLQKQEKERNEIIEKMNSGHDLPSPTEARIYLDYLEDMERTNATIIKGKVKGIAATTALPVALGFSTTAILSIFLPSTITQYVEASLLWSYTIASIEDFVISAKKLAESDYFIPGAHLIKYIQDSSKTIKEKKEENELINVKASRLREIENVDRMVMAKSYSIEEFDKTLEDEKLESLNLKNTIMKNLDDLVNRINLLNSGDKKELLVEVKSILDEYTERYNNIINQDKTIIDMEADNFVKLKIDTLTKIAELETKIMEIRYKDVEIKQVTDESKLLTDKIEGFSELNALDLQKVHEQTEKKVKVKSLRENKKGIK